MIDASGEEEVSEGSGTLVIGDEQDIAGAIRIRNSEGDEAEKG